MHNTFSLFYTLSFHVTLLFSDYVKIIRLYHSIVTIIGMLRNIFILINAQCTFNFILVSFNSILELSDIITIYSESLAYL